MAERARARMGDELVTILEVHGRGKNAKVDIRDGFGFPKTVKASDLKPLEAGAPEAKLRFGSPDS